MLGQTTLSIYYTLCVKVYNLWNGKRENRGRLLHPRDWAPSWCSHLLNFINFMVEEAALLDNSPLPSTVGIKLKGTWVEIKVFLLVNSQIFSLLSFIVAAEKIAFMLVVKIKSSLEKMLWSLKINLNGFNFHLPEVRGGIAILTISKLIFLCWKVDFLFRE